MRRRNFIKSVLYGSTVIASSGFALPIPESLKKHAKPFVPLAHTHDIGDICQSSVPLQLLVEEIRSRNNNNAINCLLTEYKLLGYETNTHGNKLH